MLCEAGQQFEHLGRVERRNKLGIFWAYALFGNYSHKGVVILRNRLYHLAVLAHPYAWEYAPRPFGGLLRDLAEIIESHCSAPPCVVSPGSCGTVHPSLRANCRRASALPVHR